MKLRLTALFTLTLLTGCIATNPLQIPDEEWANMSTEQRLRAHEAQAKLDQQRSERMAREEERRAAAERQQQAEQARLKRLRYDRASYGDIVQCVLEPGRARQSKGWRSTEPMAFEVMRDDESRPVLFDYKGREMYEMSVRLNRRGSHMELCINSGRQCDGVKLRQDDLRRGINSKIKLGEKVKGTLHCSLKYLPSSYN